MELEKDLTPEDFIFSLKKINYSELVFDSYYPNGEPQPFAEGTYGFVYKGTYSNYSVAIKKFKSKDSFPEFLKEMQTMSKVISPNVCLIYGYCEHNNDYYIIMELLRDSLDKLISSIREKYTLFYRLDFAVQAGRGILWLHSSSPPVIHRDLKPANLLFSPDGKVKVCDFGLSQTLDAQRLFLQDSETAKGTPLYMAPEVFEGKRFNEKIDIYAFGLIIWELITGHTVFSNYTKLAPFRRAIVGGERPLIYTKQVEDDPDLRNKVLELFSDKLLVGRLDVIKSISALTEMWDPNPNNRPDISIVLNRLKSIMISLIEDKESQEAWQGMTNETNYFNIDYGTLEQQVLN